MKLNKTSKILSLILIIGIIAIVFVIFLKSKLPAREKYQETHQETQRIQKTIEVIGKISVAGFGPYETELVIDLSDGTSYSIVGEKVNELWELQGKKIRAIGIEGGPTLVCTRSLEIIRYEILNY